MRVINFGSMCIDNAFHVPHFVQPGETLIVDNHKICPGGKGLNQSVALARAGCPVTHAGFIGKNGSMLLDALIVCGVDTSLIKSLPDDCGHSLIQINPAGENSILLIPGTNTSFTEAYVDSVLKTAQKDDIVLLQNETNCIPFMIQRSKELGLKVVVNLAPATKDSIHYPLHLVDVLIVNEVEAESLTAESHPNQALNVFSERYPNTAIILTLGEQGAIYKDARQKINVPAERVSRVVDTTGAGDTFTGFFLAHYLRQEAIELCLQQACKAAAICVSREGTTPAIPLLEELNVFETA